MVPNICGVCREERNDLISLKFIDEAGPILRKLKRFIDRSVSKFYNRNVQFVLYYPTKCVFLSVKLRIILEFFDWLVYLFCFV